jgi:O-antigen/teichoic acid export membrane protein
VDTREAEGVAVTQPATGGARRVLRNTGLLAVSRVGDRVSTFVLAVLIAPKLGPSGLGVYAAAMAVYSVLSIAGEAGTTNFLVREIAKDESRTGAYIVHLTVMAVGVCTALTLALEAITWRIYSGDLRTSIAIIEIAVLATVLNSIQEAAFVAYGRTEFEAVATLIQSTLYVLVGAYLLHAGYDIPALMAAYVILEYAVTIVYFPLIARYIAPLRLRFQWALAKKLAIEIKAFTASSAIAALFSRPEVIILSLMASRSEVGYYGAAVRIAELPLFVPQVFMTNVFPLMSKAHGSDPPRFQSLHDRSAKYVLAFSLPIAALLIATAPQIIDTLFGDAFDNAVPDLRVLALNVTFFSLLSVFWRTLYACNRQGTVLRVQVIVIILRLALSVALIARFASSGAAVAATAATAVQLVMLMRASKETGVHSSLLRLSWRYGVAAAVTGISAWIVVQSYGLVVTGVVALAIFVVSCFASGAIGADERRLFGRLRGHALE